MVSIEKLVNYTNDYLSIDQIKDYETIEKAAKAGVQALIVHHGFFWKNEDPCLLGMKYQRIRALIEANINLIAYHLPLDVHPVVGNNVLLAKELEIELDGFSMAANCPNLIAYGHFPKPISAAQFAKKIAVQLKRDPLHVSAKADLISKIALCTGAAQDFISHPTVLSCDAYLTGEASERTYYAAKESNLHFFAAGHHATERFGVWALGEKIAQQFQLEHIYLETDNPI